MLKEGDEKAFSQLYDQFYSPMFCFAKKYLHDEDMVRDVLQDVFIKIWQKRETLDPDLSFQNFLFTLLKNQLLNTIRKRDREILRLAKAFENSGELINFTDFYYRKNHFLEVFEKGINEMPEKKKLIFKMHNIQGFSSQEIAGSLGLSVNTVKSQITKANIFLKDYIKKFL
ncbi:RNA polymerase sigma factor [Pleomorphovibrio marinus]|uniref:RNA polymerase sigma factor n=1 Tax=Pleomorphovibrio marinus TaxID=2164132 RepID=UPI000E0B8083|nr:RNA polymerase sigma-70 factor [Pleomorphovibrio marinus]